LIDGDASLLDLTTYALRREGLSIITALDGARGLHAWHQDRPDVVVTSDNLQRISGLDLCRKIRQGSRTPVIILSSSNEEAHILHAFRMGADDYVVKPFSMPQLAMRIRAVTSRGQVSGHLDENQDIRVGELVISMESHEASNGVWTTRLTPIEFRLMYLLASNPGRVVSSARLVEYAWGYSERDVSLLKTHICHLRRKLRLQREGYGDIVAVPSVGYRLNIPYASQPQILNQAVATSSA